MKECECSKLTKLFENEEGIMVCGSCGGYRGYAHFYGSCREQMEMMVRRDNAMVEND
jgi:hypothetical protein